jgi:hypothetical protein
MKKLLLIFIIINLYGCCKDCTDDTNPSCPNYNPCKNAKETKANFRNYTYVEQRYSGMFAEIPDYHEMSTSAGFWTIDTTQKYDYWEWHIGTEIIPLEKIVTRRNFPEGQEIPITLVVKNTPNKKCFPNDDGMDTLTKNYLALDYTHYNFNSSLIGTYEMQYTNHPTNKDKFKFKILKIQGKLTIDTFPDISCVLNIPFVPFEVNLYGDNNQVIFEAYICNRDEKKVQIVWLRRKAKNSNEIEMYVSYNDYPINTKYYATGKKIQ